MSNALRLVIPIATCLCLQLGSPDGVQAQSDSTSADNAAKSPEYKRTIDQAVSEFKRGNWEEAAALFERAHRLAPSARTLRGMGITAFEARRYVDALTHLKASLVDKRRPLPEDLHKQVRQLVERCRTFVATLHLTTLPPDAAVSLDGRDVTLNEKGELSVDPGMHELSVDAPEHLQQVRRFQAVAGNRAELDVELRAAGGGDGSQQASTPASSPTTSDAGPNPRSRLRPWAYVTGGVAVLSAAGAAAAFTIRGSALRDWNNDSRCLIGGTSREENCGSDMDRADAALAAGIGLASGAGAFAVTSLVLFLTGREHEGRASSCGSGPGHFGVNCRYTF